MISYRKFGSGPEQVVLIHGWMVDGRVWRKVWEKLAANPKLTILVPDLRGSGESGRSDSTYTLDRYAEDLVELLARESVSNYWVVGHSMGGTIAQKLISTHPSQVRGVVLAAPVPASGMPMPNEARIIFRQVSTNAETAKTLLAGLVAPGHETLADEVFDISRDVDPAAISQAFSEWSDADFAETVNYSGSVSVWYGEHDEYITRSFLQRTMCKFLPQSAIQEIAGAGHYIPLEEPDQLISGIIRLMDPSLH